jgi:hypothetical protein
MIAQGLQGGPEDSKDPLGKSGQQTVLLVGGTGRTGRRVLEQLVSRGVGVRAIVRSTRGLMAGIAGNPGVAPIEASLLSLSDLDLQGHLRGCDAATVERPADGCVLAALGSEARQQHAPVRRAFAEAARGFLGHLQGRLHPTGDSRHLNDDTLALAARMVGAVVLARLVDDQPLANQILKAAKRA